MPYFRRNESGISTARIMRHRVLIEYMLHAFEMTNNSRKFSGKKNIIIKPFTLFFHSLNWFSLSCCGVITIKMKYSTIK